MKGSRQIPLSTVKCRCNDKTQESGEGDTDENTMYEFPCSKLNPRLVSVRLASPYRGRE